MSEKLLHERLRHLHDVPYQDSMPLRIGDASLYLSHSQACALAEEIERDDIPRTEHEADVKSIIEAQRGPSGGCASAHHIMKLWAEKNGMPFEKKQTITEWLDKWFIKRPLFEDGQPVQLGDKFLRFDGKHGNDGENAVKIAAGFDSKNPCYWINDDLQGQMPVKRPAPKVLDADGVEINVGDTVWHANHQWVVIGIVYHEGQPWVQIDNTGGDTSCSVQERRPSTITHKQPDSLERLQQFAVDSAAYADGCEQDKFLEIADRLKSLIERGA